MNRCGHQDCFTCPFPDCKENTSRGIHSIPQGKESEGIRKKKEPKQARGVIHTRQGFKRMG